MLTEKQITDLQEPFKFVEHGFFQKNPYILKSAIRARLNRVAPGWILLPPELVANDENVIVMRGGIQIGDIRRYAVGTGLILRADKDGVAFDGAKLAGMVSKAYKQATSDILPRAAVEFGIGEYLKNKPKSINQDNFAPWLAKLTAPPADPNAWTVETIREWGNKWRALGLTDGQLMKSLNITERWTEFKGTVAEADKAVEAFRALDSAFTAPSKIVDSQPAQPVAVPTAPAAKLPRIKCEMIDLREGDVILQEVKSQTLGTAETRLEVTRYWGKIAAGQYKLEVKNLATGEVKPVNWSSGEVLLCDGPKVKAYAADKSLCKSPKFGVTPIWDVKPASV